MNGISRWVAASIAGGLMVAGASLGQEAKAPAAAKAVKMSEAEVVAALGKDLAAKTAADEFSGVVLLAKDGKPIFRQAYGFADLGLKVPNNPETKFNLGSINKVFTRISIEQLVLAGKLSLDDTIGKWLPDYPNKDAAAKVTIHQLLDMRSGLGDIFTEEFDKGAKDQLLKVRDLFVLFADKPLLFEPGTKQQYSNAGYVVLGAIVEAASGQDYFDYVREHIYKPAGMTSTDSWELDGGTTSFPPSSRGAPPAAATRRWTTCSASTPLCAAAHCSRTAARSRESAPPAAPGGATPSWSRWTRATLSSCSPTTTRRQRPTWARP
jgi:CubicO group peptidase (beta-lactamase class C family)